VFAAPLAVVREAAAGATALHPRGSGQWWPDAPPGARILDLSSLDHVPRIDAADLVATVGAGCRLDRLADALGAQGCWLALDPPGPLSRTLGGALAAGGGGPLAALFGPPRDQVLGMTLIAGNGVLLRVGGRVVKNVAGFDLAKAVVGGHGGFGAIVEVHLRLRARAGADRTAAWSGPREAVAAACKRLMAAGALPAAFEVLHPALAAALGLDAEWALLVRALGTPAAADEELAAAHDSARALVRATPAEDVWTAWREAVGGWPVVLRIGADPAAWTDACALAAEHLGTIAGASVTVPRGTVRVGAPGVTPAALRALRAVAARRRWPVTLERADAATRAACGVWGALDPGLERLTRALRRTFDPNGVFAVPLVVP
jgi:glycolate oxidase FAD binding subunit